ncbi:MAG: hypothetical protein D6795_16485, partial [Deltaproteobacteria bacterium]
VTPNDLPIANAGEDIEVVDEDRDDFETVRLDGTASFDPDGEVISWTWTENGTVIAEGAQPTLRLETGYHRITLTVTDDVGAEGWDEVVVDINEPSICGMTPAPSSNLLLLALLPLFCLLRHRGAGKERR